MPSASTADKKEPVMREAPTVDRLGAGELAAAADLLAKSFVDEGIMSYLLRTLKPEVRARVLRPWFRVMLRTFSPHGEIHTARLNGTLVGVGIRVPPDAYPPKGIEQVRFIARILPVILRVVARTPAFREVSKVISTFEKVHPKEAHWYLMWLGVDPDMQRRGIGAALADEVIGLADAQEAPCYLETFGAHTKRLYERRGFQVRDEVHPIPDGPAGWTLWRPAQTKGA